MTGKLPRERRAPPQRPWPAWFVWSGVVYIAVAASIAGVRAGSTTDFRDFWENGLHFRQTGEISTTLGVHNYLPVFTILAAPASLLDLPIAVAVFVAFSLLLFGKAAALLEQHVRENAAPAGGERAAPLGSGPVALLLLLPYVHTCAMLGALGLVLVALMIFAWVLADRGGRDSRPAWNNRFLTNAARFPASAARLVQPPRPLAAGALLGLATVLKLLPGVLIVLLALLGRWRAAAASLATLALLALGVPLVVLGWEGTLRAHAAFYKTAVVEHSAVSTLLADKPVKANYSNNALPIVLRRLLSPVDGGKEQQAGGLFVNVADLPWPQIVAIYGAVMTLFAGASLWVALRARREPVASPVRQASIGAWFCLALLASPLVWTHYLVLALPPLMLLVERVRVGHRTGTTPWLALFALGVWVLAAAALAWPAARAAGAQLLAVAALWTAMVGYGLMPRSSSASAATSD